MKTLKCLSVRSLIGMKISYIFSEINCVTKFDEDLKCIYFVVLACSMG